MFKKKKPLRNKWKTKHYFKIIIQFCVLYIPKKIWQILLDNLCKGNLVKSKNLSIKMKSTYDSVSYFGLNKFS